MIEINEITAGYGRVAVLDKVSARFSDHRLTALIGPNGCGKSTLLKAIMGFLPLKHGSIWLEGQPINRLRRKTLARKVAYLPQECFCPDYMTLGELIELAGYSRYSLTGGPSENDRKLYRDVLEIVGLTDQADRQVNRLSGGQRQRAWVAMVLAQNTDIILMDEPVNHLDVKYQYAILELIKELIIHHGKTVIIVLHDLNLTSTFADDVIMLHNGVAVAKGSVSETMTPNNIRQVFDLDADIFPRHGRLVCLPQMPHSEKLTA